MLLVISMVLSSFVSVSYAAVTDPDNYGSVKITGLHPGATIKYRHIIRGDRTKATGWEFYPETDGTPGSDDVMYWFALSYGVEQNGMTVDEWEQEVIRAVIQDYVDRVSDADHKDGNDTASAAINGSEKFRKAIQDVIKYTGEIKNPLTDDDKDGTILVEKDRTDENHMGLYLIVPQNTNKYVYNPTAAFLNFGYMEGEIYSIDQVTAKAKGILNVVNKTADEGSKSLAIGDTAEFTITATYPTFADQYKDTAIYTISDTSEQLTKYNVVSVTLGGKTLTKGTHYTVESHPSGRGFVIKLLDGNGSLPAFDSNNAGLEVKVDYTAVVEKLTDNGQVKNTATVTTQPDSNSDAWTTDSVVITDTYEVHLTKVNEYGHTLSGAIFQAVRKDGKYVTFSYDSNTKTYKVKGYSDTLTSECKINISSRLGVILAGLDAEETYTLTEIHAPSGYLVSDKTIVLGKANTELGLTITTSSRQYQASNGVYTSETEITVTTAGNNTFNINYANTKVFQLPETGWWGTYIFTLVGVAIIVTAVIINRNRKRNKAEA